MNQAKIDTLWSKIKELFLGELKTLPLLKGGNCKSDKRKLRKSSPFWNDELTNLWSNTCLAEKEFLDFKVRAKSDLNKKAQLRENFRSQQKIFDRRFCFRQQELEDMAKSCKNPSDMWLMLKKLSEPKSTRAASEII